MKRKNCFYLSKRAESDYSLILTDATYDESTLGAPKSWTTSVVITREGDNTDDPSAEAGGGGAGGGGAASSGSLPMIAGAAGGGALAAVVLAIWCYRRKKRRNYDLKRLSVPVLVPNQEDSPNDQKVAKHHIYRSQSFCVGVCKWV